MSEIGSKYIIYLHPARGSAMCVAFENFWKKSRYLCSEMKCANTALIYPYHATLTGFFSLDDKDVEFIVKVFREEFSNTSDLGVKKFNFYRNSLCASFLNFEQDVIKTAVKNIKNKMEGKTQINCKDGLHFTLYGFVPRDKAVKLEKYCSEEMKDIINGKFTDVSICLWKTDLDNKNWTIIDSVTTENSMPKYFTISDKDETKDEDEDKYVICLHPMSGTKLSDHFEALSTNSKNICKLSLIKNKHNDYPSHAKLTDFFGINEENLPELIKKFRETFSDVRKIPINFSYDTEKKEYRTMSGISVSSDYVEKRIISFQKSVDDVAKIRIKKPSFDLCPVMDNSVFKVFHKSTRVFVENILNVKHSLFSFCLWKKSREQWCLIEKI